MNTKAKFLPARPRSSEQALSAIIERSDIVDLAGKHLLVIDLLPGLEAYLGAFGAEESELELDDWPEEDEPAEEDDPRE